METAQAKFLENGKVVWEAGASESVAQDKQGDLFQFAKDTENLSKLKEEGNGAEGR